MEAIRAGEVPGKTLVYSSPARPTLAECPDCPWGDAWDVANGVRCGTCDRLLEMPSFPLYYGIPDDPEVPR